MPLSAISTHADVLNHSICPSTSNSCRAAPPHSSALEQIITLNQPTQQSPRAQDATWPPATPNYAARHGKYALYSQLVAGQSQVFVVDTSTNTTAQLTHTGHNTAPSFSPDASKVFYTKDHNGVQERFFKPIAGGTEYPMTSRPTLFAVGDSLTVSSYPSKLSALLKRPLNQSGISGQTSTQIAARIGAKPVTMRCEGEQVPACGAVKVSNLSIPLLSTEGEKKPITVPGTLTNHQGKKIHGALTRTLTTAGESYTFHRDEAGAAFPCPGEATFVADAQGHDTTTAVIWVGRNNYKSPQTVLDDIQTIVNWLKPYQRRFIVLSILKGDHREEYSHGTSAKKIDHINATLKARYPNNYVDVNEALRNAYNPAIQQDVIDHTHNITPSSLRRDSVHLNEEKGYTIVAKTVAAALAKNNW